MSLFKSKKSVTTKPSNNKPLRVVDKYSLPQASSFRGFRRARLSVYGNYPVIDNIDELKILNPAYTEDSDLEKYLFDFKDSIITLKIGRFVDDLYCVHVFADSYHIGSLFPDSDNSDVVDAIINHEIDKAYVKIEWQPTEIHSKGLFGNKVHTEDRFRSFLFVKSADGTICSKKKAGY